MGFSSGKKVPESFSDKKLAESVNAVKTLTPAEQAQNLWINKGWDYLNRTGQYAGKPLDVTEAPDFDAQESIYGNAEALANQRRVSIPGMSMGGINPNYSAQLAEQHKAQRYNTRAAGLTAAVAAGQAARLGQTQDSIANQMQRNQTHASLMTRANDDFTRRKQAGGWGKTLANLVFQGAGAVAGVKTAFK